MCVALITIGHATLLRNLLVSCITFGTHILLYADDLVLLARHRRSADTENQEVEDRYRVERS